MSKFHVGDKVRLGPKAYVPPGHKDMERGDIGTVIDIVDEEYPYVVQVGGETEWFDDEELRPADIVALDVPALPDTSIVATAQPFEDVISHPSHYTSGRPEGVEVIDIIRAQNGSWEHSNVLKYMLRWQYKNGLEDLKKAQQYLVWLIENEENAS